MIAKNITVVLTLSLLCLLGYNVKAQNVNYGRGTVIQETEYANIIGSPYYMDKWNTGTVIFTNNKVAENIPLKYNAKDDEVYFKDSKDQTMAFKESVKFFTFTEANGKTHIFQNGYTGPGINEKTYLEVIAGGKNQFLRKLSKTIVETKEYASSNTDRHFLDKNEYYIYTGGKLYQVKKETKSIITSLPTKQTEMKQYIKSNNLNLKNDDDIVKAFKYYNPL